MSTATVASLVDTLEELQLLEPPQWQVLAAMQPRPQDPRELAKILLRKGWLSRHQATLLFRGAGSQLIQGPYLLIEPLGEGGMGLVFKVRHRKLGNIVALKVIHRARANDPKARKRFERETQAVAQLRHPNIVQAYDAGELKGGFYLAMEYVEGRDLAKLLKEQGRLPEHLACDFIRQTALGLQHAHERGMVHRDIKPSNLLIADCGLRFSDSTGLDQSPIRNTQSAIVKILDLGLARVERSAAGESLSQVTCENLVIGTPDYIAPEQALRPHDVDSRADIYSLGCTLYHLLTGRIPFPAGTVMEKMLKHKFETAEPASGIRPEVPPELSALVSQMMAKKTADRPASAAAVAAALEPFCKELTTVLSVDAEPSAAIDANEPTFLMNQSAATPSDSPFGDTPTALRTLTRKPQRGMASWLLIGLLSLGLTCTLIILLLAVANQRSFPSGDRVDARPPNPASLASPIRNMPVTLVANQPWQDTLVDVSAGERVTIRARGRWQGAAAASTCTADGDRQATWEEAVTPTAPVMSLIARIGSSTAVIPLGQNTTFTPQLSGRLFIQANELNLKDNLGTLTLEIDGAKAGAATSAPPLLPVQALEKEWQALAARVTSARNGPNSLASELQTFRLRNPGAPQALRATQILARLPSPLDGHPARPVLRRTEGDPVEILFALGDQDSLIRKPKQAVAISPDGKLLAAGSEGYSIRLWNLEQNPPRELTALKGHSDAVRNLSFAPDGQRLLSAAYGLERTLRLWEVHADGAQLRIGGAEGASGIAGVFAPDGRHFLMGGDQT